MITRAWATNGGDQIEESSLEAGAERRCPFCGGDGQDSSSVVPTPEPTRIGLHGYLVHLFRFRLVYSKIRSPILT